MRPYTLESISVHALTSTDLRQEAIESLDGDQMGYPEAYRVQIDGHAEVAEAVHWTAWDRVGFAWGAPADFYDVQTIEQGIRQALQEQPDWDAIEREEMANAPDYEN